MGVGLGRGDGVECRGYSEFAVSVFGLWFGVQGSGFRVQGLQ